LLKPIKENTNAKIIVHLREMIPNNKSEINKFIISNHINYADKIIAITDNEIRYYPKSDKIEVIPNPHEFDLTDSLITEKENDDIIVGMCANFMEYKGQLEFLEMAKIVEENCENIDLKFEIIGYPKNTLKEIVKRIIKPGFKQKFDEQVKKLKIKNLQIIKFTFNIYEEISSWDIVVRPDYTGQPWGRDIIEAMAMKKPIVATGTSEFFVENGRTGFLVRPRKPQAMAEKVIELIKNEEMRKEFGERGYEKVKKMCDINEYGKRIKEIYEENLQ
jgi:glycosyltransferase involved in cell wall biosynthesis